MQAAAVHSNHLMGPCTAKVPMMSLREAARIITPMIGTAMTSLRSGLPVSGDPTRIVVRGARDQARSGNAHKTRFRGTDGGAQTFRIIGFYRLFQRWRQVAPVPALVPSKGGAQGRDQIDLATFTAAFRSSRSVP